MPYCANVVVTEEEKKRIFKEQHGSPLGGHSGEVKTTKKISERYYWPIISIDIKDWVCNFNI